MRDLLERQLEETDRIADASRVMLEIAHERRHGHEFNATVQNLVRSGQATRERGHALQIQRCGELESPAGL